MAASKHRQHMFRGAREFTIGGGNFTNVGGNYTIINQSTVERPGLKRLLDNIAHGAFHDAAERGDPPRCHPQTCIAIRAEIMEWVRAPPAMRKLILWMYGPAGSGKTAIAQSIAEECARLGLLAASFFFWRTAIGRNNPARFIATIAYQLSRFLPQVEEHLIAAIEQDPTIFSRSLSTQMRILVIEPLKRAVPPESLPVPMLAVVDAVDECGPNGRSQSELLHLLASVASELEDFPFIFLIASRPEYEIREAFNENLLNPLTKVLVLDNSYKPDEDIKLYFNSTFRNIYEKHCRQGRRLPLPWPPAGDIDSLVSKASGQFIFAATATKFIESPRHSPVERMNIILRLSTNTNETPFALLDELYRFILDSVADVEKVLDILVLRMLGTVVYLLNGAEELLGIEVRSALVDMHSLLYVPPPSVIDAGLPRVYHASFEDFLLDRSRSRQYSIGEGVGHLRLSRYWLKAMERFPYLQHLALGTVVKTFTFHAKRSPTSEDLANDLAQLDLRAVLEGISDFVNELYKTKWQGFFDCAKKLVGLDRLDIVLRLQNDFDMFLLDRIAQYPPSLRTHIPVLLCLLHCGGYGPGDLFRILLVGASNSAEECTEFFDLDKRLLDVFEARSPNEDETWKTFFRDKSRAEDYAVDGESFVALAKAIFSAIYSKPGERNRQIRFADIEGALYVGDGLMRIHIRNNYFGLMRDTLEKASADWELATFLRERAVQYRGDVEPIQGRPTIALASVKYIQRCGLPFLEHSHQPDINKCAICYYCEGAIVVEGIPDTPTEPPPRLPSI
ncbi:hypothetical protein BJ912DRAFT_1043214 [Pholiota molesta]|nr:hypothetical protein BJ912DRAFT_1043214 [Pholiota molesta]